MGWSALACGSGCWADPEHAIQELAQEECAYTKRCTPREFEQRCRPCIEHEECPRGACDLRSGLCQDEHGRSIPGLGQQERCVEAAACGGYVCAPRYPSAQACEDAVTQLHQVPLKRWLDRDKDPEQGCEYNAALLHECIRQTSRRACEEARPKSCELALRDCR